MRMILRTLIAAAVVAIAAGCTAPASKPVAAAIDTTAIARQVHEAYVAAINSNNLDSLLAMFTDDVVYLSPHEPAVVGKAAVRPWGEAYLKAYKIHWDKTTEDFIISGDWAFERYSYKEFDIPQGGGPQLEDTGKGLNVYHHDADGTWRVARDAWSSDLPVPAK